MNSSNNTVAVPGDWVPAPLPYPLPSCSEVEGFPEISIDKGSLNQWPADALTLPLPFDPSHATASPDPVFALHTGGKIRIQPKIPIVSRQVLARAYGSPVARVSIAIAQDHRQAWNLTGKGNSVAVVTDGTAVPGLGNIGPEAAMPSIEGKAMLFNQFGNIDAYPLCLRAKDESEFIQTVCSLGVGFGAINLAAMAAPGCFVIERQLQERLDIPVFDDYQHGTAIVVLAGLINALRLSGQKLRDAKIVVAGAGAAGTAIVKILLRSGARNLLVCDRRGILHSKRANLTSDVQQAFSFCSSSPARRSPARRDEGGSSPARHLVRHSLSEGGSLGGGGFSKNDAIHALQRTGSNVRFTKPWLARHTNPQQLRGSLAQALAGAHVFIGASVPRAFDPRLIKIMAPKPVIFALATPIPEILPEDAGDAFIIATSQSDYPNHINNVLAFPGIFRGALDVRATRINEQMEIAAARAIARCIHPLDLAPGLVVPSVFNRGVVLRVAEAVRHAAIRTGVARVH